MPEGAPKNLEQQNPSYEDEITYFRETRGFREEDMPLLHQLENIPKNEIMGFHNFFDTNRSKEVLLQQMKNMIAGARFTTQGREYFTVMAEIVEKYDIYTANHLKTILEAR